MPYNHVKISPHNCCKCQLTIIVRSYKCWKIAQLYWLMLGWSCVSIMCAIIIGHSDIIVVIVFLKPSQWCYYISAQKNWNCSELAEFPWFGDSSCDSYWSPILLCRYVITSLGRLQEYNDYNDVTMAYDDGTQVRHTRSSLHQPVKSCNFPTFVRPL